MKNVSVRKEVEGKSGRRPAVTPPLKVASPFYTITDRLSAVLSRTPEFGRADNTSMLLSLSMLQSAGTTLPFTLKATQ